MAIIERYLTVSRERETPYLVQCGQLHIAFLANYCSIYSQKLKMLLPDVVRLSAELAATQQQLRQWRTLVKQRTQNGAATRHLLQQFVTLHTQIIDIHRRLRAGPLSQLLL